MPQSMRFYALICLMQFLILKPAFSQWVQVHDAEGEDTWSFAVDGQKLYAGTYVGVFLTTNDGESWTHSDQLNDGTALAVIGFNVFAGTYCCGPYRSDDDGAHWRTANGGLTRDRIRALAASGTKLYAGTDTGVYISTNYGTSWLRSDSGMKHVPVNVLAVRPDGSGAVFAGTYYGGIYRTLDEGLSWTPVNAGLTGTDVRALAFNGSNLFAGTTGNNNIYLTTNNGTSWYPANGGLPQTTVASLACSGTLVFVGSYQLYVSRDNGKSWSNITGNLPHCDVFALAVRGNYLFAGTGGGCGIWRRDLSDLTDLGTHGGEVPNGFALQQNHPNPCNPYTKIAFSLPSRSAVSLKVFDASGRQVSTLISKELGAGRYETTWDAAGVPGGVYFYMLDAGGFSVTKKLVVGR